MCNLYRLQKAPETIRDLADAMGIALGFPEGVPNLAPGDVRITDRAAMLRAVAGEPARADLVIRRWSWPGQGGRPVYNFRSEGRDFASGRCVIPADGFYEFTAPADPKAKRKTKWLFTLKGSEMFGIAGLWRAVPDIGEAWTMLTSAPGADVAPYHGRQVVVLPPERWKDWLNPGIPAHDLLKPLPAGSLKVERVA